MSPMQLQILEVACNARSINPESISFELDREPKDCQAPIARLIECGWLAGSVWDARITEKGAEAMNAEHRKLQAETEE